MPRYMIERTFPERWDIPSGPDGGRLLADIIACNSDRSVNWIHSHVSADGLKTFCIYDAPNPESIRRAARTNGLPVDRIIEISLLDPYAYHLI